jgi:hypothetical protein
MHTDQEVHGVHRAGHAKRARGESDPTVGPYRERDSGHDQHDPTGTKNLPVQPARAAQRQEPDIERHPREMGANGDRRTAHHRRDRAGESHQGDVATK